MAQLGQIFFFFFFLETIPLSGETITCDEIAQV